MVSWSSSSQASSALPLRLAKSVAPCFGGLTSVPICQVATSRRNFFIDLLVPSKTGTGILPPVFLSSPLAAAAPPAVAMLAATLNERYQS